MPPGEPRGTALLVPGYTGSKEDFLALLPLLAAGGYRAVAVDQRGQHESPRAERPEGYDVPALAGDVLAAAGALDERGVHLLGHSFGGLVVQAAAIAAPERLRSLTLLATGPGAVPEGPRTADLRLVRSSLPTIPMDVAWDVKRARELAAGVPPEAPEAQEFLRARWMGTSPESLVRIAVTLLEAPDRVGELQSRLAGAGVPVLVLNGDRDDAWPPAVQAQMAQRLGAAYVSLPGVGHSPNYEAPEATAAALLEHWARA
nr:alpha/beta hydrolase [Motilibacter aurantiacus]